MLTGLSASLHLATMAIRFKEFRRVPLLWPVGETYDYDRTTQDFYSPFKPAAHCADRACCASPLPVECARRHQAPPGRGPTFFLPTGSTPFTSATSSIAYAPDPRELSRLVHLLPRAFHTAILQACCCGRPANAMACVIPPLPPCSETCVAAGHRASSATFKDRKDPCSSAARALYGESFCDAQC